MDWMELDTDGNSRKPEKKKSKSVKPNMTATVKGLRGFNGMVGADLAVWVSLFLSLLKREQRDNREIQSTDLIHDNSILETRVLCFVGSESFLLLFRSLSHCWGTSLEYEGTPLYGFGCFLRSLSWFSVYIGDLQLQRRLGPVRVWVKK
jgi:hypothetical protein